VSTETRRVALSAHDPLVKLQSSHSEAPRATDPRHAVITQRRDGESNTHTRVSGVTARSYYDRGTSKKTASGAAQLATCQGGRLDKCSGPGSTSSLKPPPLYIWSPRGPLLAPVECRATAQGVVLIGEQLNRQPAS